jgi:hypothetical protein
MKNLRLSAESAGNKKNRIFYPGALARWLTVSTLWVALAFNLLMAEAFLD